MDVVPSVHMDRSAPMASPKVTGPIPCAPTACPLRGPCHINSYSAPGVTPAELNTRPYACPKHCRPSCLPIQVTQEVDKSMVKRRCRCGLRRDMCVCVDRRRCCNGGCVHGMTFPMS